MPDAAMLLDRSHGEGLDDGPRRLGTETLTATWGTPTATWGNH